jgi:hypothetical protein
MVGDKNHNLQLKKLLDQLADSVLPLSDQEIMAEIHETGEDPQAEAERTRAVLRQGLTLFEAVNNRLSALGHTVDSKHWRHGEKIYYNNCLTCGRLVSFTTTDNGLREHASDERCPKSNENTIAQTGSI